MENIRRQIKLFWVSHGGPIKLGVLIIIGIIFVLNLLDELAIEKQKEEKKVLGNETIKTEITKDINKEEKKDIRLINDFLRLCENEEIEEAYKLLSKQCKNEKFLTIEEFKEKYVDIKFEKRKDIEVEYDSERKLYKIIFLEDMLESGKIKNRDSNVEFYKVVQEDNYKRIYICDNTTNTY